MITLVLGGVRSGKSEVAERLAGPGPGTYLATGLVTPGDDDFAERVAHHRARRPASWATVEEPRAVPAVLARLHGPVLLDALGTWIANDPRPDLDALVQALVSRRGDTIVVSEEVGLGVHPVSEVGRLFADRLGEANRRVAEVADRCLLVVAGRVIDLPAGTPAPGEAASTGRRPATGTAASGDAASVGTPTAAGTARSGEGASGTPPATGAAASTDAASVGTPPATGAAASRDAASTGRPPATGTPPAAGVTAPAAGMPPFATDRGAASGSVMGGLREAVAFLTPLGGATAPSPAAFSWFPVVGALIGLLLGGLWWAAEEPLGPLAAAALVVAADLALTGALHFDGLLDSADGLLPHLRPERRLAVMADPNVGAFAVATGATTLLLRTAALAALGTARPFLLAALWSLSRTAMAVTALTGRYARSHGLASSFLPDTGTATHDRTGPAPAGRAAGNQWVLPASVGAVLAVVLAVGNEISSVVAVVAGGLAAAAVAALARRRIGGFTGDTLGAGGVVAETIGLLTAVAVLRP
ncbi:MAG: bifunctional adenosylcobinamide kinase/adenosylcobinamide-phosphate guanylyltransferase [Actinomycetota bacterium]